jgi:hypothetical protein
MNNSLKTLNILHSMENIYINICRKLTSKRLNLCTFYIRCLLAGSTVLEKLMATQLVQKSTAYRIRMFITVFTTASYLMSFLIIVDITETTQIIVQKEIQI